MNSEVKPEVQKIFMEIQALSPPDRLRFAADCLERGYATTANSVIKQVSAELGAVLLFAKYPPKKSGNERG